MVKANVHNVILIMSDWVGLRFDADGAKQYCMMGGKHGEPHEVQLKKTF